ncbi:hypothetical protein C9F11_38245 [Streptomyces sp. YIM 121038]|uniref:DUF2058 domain-containing protein n=1 Tax=Streptomyces sp. YIM 121038 TaxID=2136401 RepID=UPI0011108BE6|nr:DUF2058 domain-containing protein [Streptomyces sp. YIM 121038]QCX81232.1 hypothetical protein C9F11_38245 [Streptomyces sp. YIM 121038]
MPVFGDWRPVTDTPEPAPVDEQRALQPEPAGTSAPSSRREQKRQDRRAQREDDRADRAQDREEKRRDKAHRRQLKDEARQAELARKQQERAEREKARARRRKERRAAWLALQVKLAHHMPLWGLPVVAVSLVMGWSGQAGAASHLGMGWAAAGVPVLTEGMTLTLAGLTGQAIEHRRPYRWLLWATWVTAIISATINGLGHLIEDDTVAGVYRASAYAGASLAALVLWAVVMRSKRAAVSGRTAEEIARWKRLRRRHPILMRRARRIADNTGTRLEDAYAKAWERANGAKLGEPSIREIRASRRAAYRRREAESWNGQRGRRSGSKALKPVVPASEHKLADTPGEAMSPSPAGRVQAPVLPVPLLIPGAEGEWVSHPVPVRPLTASQHPRAHSERTATPRFPQGKDAVSKRVREDVTDDRVKTVRRLVAEAAENNQDLRKHPSNRAVARHLGCRPATARELLTAVLAERGITRKKDQ